MATLGLWLLVIAATDLGRLHTDAVSRRRQVALLGQAAVLLTTFTFLIEAPTPTKVMFAFGGFAGVAGWLLFSAHALERHRPAARWLASAALVISTLVMTAPFPAELRQVPHDLITRTGPELVLLVTAVMLLQIGTVNVAVRLLLDAVGVPATSHEQRLRGGRVLGPLERIFIVGVGLAGSLAAAAVVIAAKGLLRYPEIKQDTDHPSELSEYFLIGSFASWLLALSGVWLVQIAA